MSIAVGSKIYEHNFCVGDVNQLFMVRVLTVCFQNWFHRTIFISFHKTRKMLEPLGGTSSLFPNRFVACCSCSWRS